MTKWYPAHYARDRSTEETTRDYALTKKPDSVAVGHLERFVADNDQIVYRRGMEEPPARKEEVEHAQHEGVQFRDQRNFLPRLESNETAASPPVVVIA